MKRFWLILLSLGLVMAFSASAFAVDVKFSGSYYAAGMYLDQVNLAKSGTTAGQNMDTAFYFQRARVNMDFIVSPGLKLVTRFDALERIWGGARSTPGTTDYPYTIATQAEEQNIAFNLMYIEYASPIGLFDVGYIHDNSWGTPNGFWMNDEYGYATGGIQYILPVGPFIFGGVLYKEQSSRYSAFNPAQTSTDVDNDKYILFALFNFKGGDVGILGGFDRGATLKPVGLLVDAYFIAPKVQAKIGPVDLQAMFVYAWGSEAGEQPGFVIGLNKVNLQAILGDIQADVNLGMFFFGGQFAYISGPGTDPTNVKGGWMQSGQDWNPCLIMFNQDITYWVGGINTPGGVNASAPGLGMENAYFFQVDGGIRPIPKLSIKAAVAYAMADTKPAGFTSNSYGWELDVTGSYKITNNLSYMLGVGYWWPGDYYKGIPSGAGVLPSIRDDYMVLNKLTLTF